jgi:hypothetical protein
MGLSLSSVLLPYCAPRISLPVERVYVGSLLERVSSLPGDARQYP